MNIRLIFPFLLFFILAHSQDSLEKNTNINDSLHTAKKDTGFIVKDTSLTLIDSLHDSLISSIPNDSSLIKTNPSSKSLNDGNPFVSETIQPSQMDTNSQGENDTQSQGDNPFAEGNDKGDDFQAPVELMDESLDPPIYTLIDLSLGFNYSKFYISPENLQVQGKRGFCFNPGVLFTIKQWLFTGISLRYSNILLSMSHTEKTVGNKPITTMEINGIEEMSFVSLPIKVGVQYKTEIITPFIYACIEPAYLSACHKLVTTEITTEFEDGHKEYHKRNDDINTIKFRERYQVFLGVGLGTEFTYGYGSVYVDLGFLYGLRDTDTQKDIVFIRNSSTMLYFPITIGIRFFL